MVPVIIMPLVFLVLPSVLLSIAWIWAICGPRSIARNSKPLFFIGISLFGLFINHPGKRLLMVCAGLLAGEWFYAGAVSSAV